MHEVEVYRGTDRDLIHALKGALKEFCVEVHVHVRPVRGEASARRPSLAVVLTPVRALTSELLNELRRAPDPVLRYVEGFICGHQARYRAPGR